MLICLIKIARTLELLLIRPFRFTAVLPFFYKSNQTHYAALLTYVINVNRAVTKDLEYLEDTDPVTGKEIGLQCVRLLHIVLKLGVNYQH